MPRFRVVFYKTVPDDIGHDHRSPQKEFVVLADDEDAARTEAARLYALSEGCDWRLRADVMDVETTS